MKKTLLLIVMLPIFSVAQINLDSLWNVWSDTNQPDTCRIEAMKKISWDGYLFQNPDTANYFAQMQYDFAKEKGMKDEMAHALNTQGASFYLQGIYSQAIDRYTKSLELRKEIGDQKGLAGSLNNIGLIYKEQGNSAKAIDCYTQSLQLQEKIGDRENIATSLNNIGSIYFQQEDYLKAIDYFDKSLKIQREIDDERGIASSLNNIGLIYHEQGDFTKALDYYTRSLEIRNEIGEKKSISSSLNNIGIIYKEQGDYRNAIEYYSKALQLRKEIGDKKGIASSLNNIGSLYLDKGDYSKSLEFSLNSLEMALEIGVATQTKIAAKTLWKSYKSTHQFEKALEMYELYSQTKDSIESKANQKEVIRQRLKYDYDKQAAADSVRNQEAQKVKEAELFVERAENKQRKQQAYLLYGGLALAILFGAFTLNRFHLTNKQKGVIELQKGIVDVAYKQLESKNGEIMDSINYAKRIQLAILPPDNVIKENLPESFILYKPKDIVAGDFYWLEQKKNKIFFAAADCTGHGVPGAMVSVVCNNALNRSVREHNLTDPGQILDRTRAIVIEEFAKSTDDVKDGMDIALCSLEDNILTYAGANNPLWIIRKDGKNIEEIKADKQPIGKFYNPLPYTSHTVQLSEGDLIYIFSDGYVDQFGGENNKKFKPKALKELLLSVRDKSMEEQKILIEKVFENYRGDQEQIDDVCVMGVRI